jgi:hypothetical protein
MPKAEEGGPSSEAQNSLEARPEYPKSPPTTESAVDKDEQGKKDRQAGGFRGKKWETVNSKCRSINSKCRSLGFSPELSFSPLNCNSEKGRRASREWESMGVLAVRW